MSDPFSGRATASAVTVLVTDPSGNGVSGFASPQLEAPAFSADRRALLESVVDWQHLPGGDLVTQGLEDLEASRETVESLLASVAASRLRARGLAVPRPFTNPEHRLYTLLAAEDSDSAHSRYNALLRRLQSFESALECVS